MPLRFDDLLSIWTDYSNYWCVSNEWLKEPMFCVQMSQILKCTFVDGGIKHGIREHFFINQNSRSGKGQIMKAVHHMFKFFNEDAKNKHIDSFYNTFYSSSEMTPQALAGGSETRPTKGGKGNEKIWIDGMLKTYHYLAWGEGIAVIKPQNRYGDVRSVLLNALDDGTPVGGSARKDLGADGIMHEFYPISSIVTGTNESVELTPTILTSGILQRFLFSHKTLSKSNLSTLTEKMMELQSIDAITESREIKNEFIKNLYSKNYQKEIFTPKEVTKEYIEFILKDLENLSHEYGEKQKNHEILMSFHIARLNHNKKISTIIASLEGEKTMHIDFLKRANDISQQSIWSARRVLDRTDEPSQDPATLKRQDVVFNFLKKYGKMNKKEIVKLLKKSKDFGEWGKGREWTENFLEELVERGVISASGGGKGNERVFWFEN